MGAVADALQYPVDQGTTGKQKSTDATTPPADSDANHLFANNVRFLSMAAIIAVHSLSVYPILRHGEGAAPFFLLCVAQLFKFGTIAFFLVAGFLFGERIDQYSSLQYYTRRLKNVLLPWLVWFSIYCVLRVATDVAHGKISLHSPGAVRSIYNECIGGGLLGTAYWFVPNLLIALGVLLVFRRVLRDTRVGAAFLLVSIFYAGNIYMGWIPVQHSKAVFGFIFYLWLGAWGAWHFEAVSRWVARIPAAAMLGLIVLANVLAIGEAKLLLSLHSTDALNTLRITNQICSTVAVLAIMKLKQATWPRFVNVRAHTFGLYLTHSIGLASLKQILLHVAFAAFWGSAAGAALALPIAFFIAYGGCLLVVRALLSCSWLRWTTGVAGSTRSVSARQTRQGQKMAPSYALSAVFPLKTERLAPSPMAKP